MNISPANGQPSGAPACAPFPPSDIKRQILQNLSLRDRARVARADRSWADACSDPSLWQRQLVPPQFRIRDGKTLSPEQAFNAWVQTFDDGEKQELRQLYAFHTQQDCRRWFYLNKRNEKLMWAAVAYFPDLLVDGPYGLRQDEALLTLSIRADGCNIRLADSEQKKDPALGLLAVTQNGWALEYLDETLQKREDIRERALLSVQRASYQANAESVRSASTRLTQDAEFMAILQHQRSTFKAPSGGGRQGAGLSLETRR
jgi:hypothetical protein